MAVTTGVTATCAISWRPMRGCSSTTICAASAPSRRDSGLLRVIDRQGTERVWMYHNVRSEEPGEEPYVLGHALDITERVRADQAIRRSRGELKKAYRELDERVKVRTVELEAANEQLRAEIAERQRAEAMREQILLRERNTPGLPRECQRPVDARARPRSDAHDAGAAAGAVSR